MNLRRMACDEPQPFMIVVACVASQLRLVDRLYMPLVRVPGGLNAKDEKFSGPRGFPATVSVEGES